MFKIACYGVRPNEVETFHEMNTYDYDLTLIEPLLDEKNVELAEGHDAVLLRANCLADRKNLEIFKSYGIKYVFTRTVGTNHIDLDAAKELGQVVAYVPGYSPNAIAELSLTLGMTLLRNVQYTADRTSRGKFTVTPQMFSKEVRNSTVGIIGTGRIGLVEAKLYQGLGARVVGYDVYESDAAKEVVEFMTQDELLAQSDIVSIHVPHIKGENDEMINADFINKMKDDAILVNTSRGELQNNEAVVSAIKNNELAGFATDVIPNEGETYFKDFDSVSDITDASVRELVSLYPKVLITPHVGSNSHEALRNMVGISYDNFKSVLDTGTSENLV